MDELKKLYQARAILATSENGVPEVLQERIEQLEAEVIKSRLDDFNIAANNFLLDIETPFVVTVMNDPNIGVTVNIQPQKKSNPKPVKFLSFEQYLDNLDVKKSTINGYKRSIDDFRVVAAIGEFTGCDSLYDIKDVDKLQQVIDDIPTSYKGGLPHSMLTHYATYLLKSGLAFNKD